MIGCSSGLNDFIHDQFDRGEIAVVAEVLERVEEHCLGPQDGIPSALSQADRLLVLIQLVVERIGTGSAALSSAATPVFLDEYTTAASQTGPVAGATVALPAVATDVSGTREVIVHGETGLLARADDVGALGAAMANLMRMPSEKRRAMGERARRRIVERFSLETVLDQWEELYTNLLERSARRGIRLSVREALTRASATSA